MQTEAIRAQLEEELKALYSRSGRIDEHWRNHAAQKDWEELATLRENDEVISSLDDLTREKIHQVETALRRIEAGTYGTCKQCGKPIEASRLQAMPTVATCASCALALEEKGFRP